MRTCSNENNNIFLLFYKIDTVIEYETNGIIERCDAFYNKRVSAGEAIKVSCQ